RPDVVLVGQLVEHFEDDLLDVVLLVPEVVEQRLQGGVDDLELSRREVEPEGDFAGLNEIVGHRSTGRYRCKRARATATAARTSVAAPMLEECAVCCSRSRWGPRSRSWPCRFPPWRGARPRRPRRPVLHFRRLPPCPPALSWCCSISTVGTSRQPPGP